MPTTPFNLDLATYERICTLIYGPYGCGKTHLQGDFLRYCSAKGPVAFVNIRGEDGFTSIGGAGLGTVGYSADSRADFDSLMEHLARQRLAGLAVDSLTGMYELMLLDKYGKIRFPDPKLDGEGAKSAWGQLNMGLKDAVLKTRAVAPNVLWVAPDDRSDDVVDDSGKGITPNLPGKLAREIAGRFDFVGRLSTTTLASGVQRKVMFRPVAGILTRQRCPVAIKDDILIPEGGGGWANIMAAVAKAFQTKQETK